MQKSFPKYGFSSNSAYFKVTTLNVLLNSSGWNVKFAVNTYFSATAKSTGSAPIETNWYVMNYSTTSANQDQYNVVKTAYEFLKTQSEFSGATDV